MINVLFLIQDRQMPSSRVRVLNLIPELEKAGLGCEIAAYPRSLSGKFRMLMRCARNQITFLQKKIPSPVETGLIRLFSRKLVFDFDDAVYCRHEARGGSRSRSREIKSRAVLKFADLVIAGNGVLKQYADAFNRDVRILPSCVEVRGIPVQTHRKSGGPIVIGWVGGRINLPHLATLIPVFQNLAKLRDIEVHVVCDQGLDIPGVRVRHIPWTLEAQDFHIAGFDIGVMPLPDSWHARGKCGYKAIQCMAAKVPVVVSDVGFNRELVAHGVDGFRAAALEDFEKHLLELVDSAELRLQMGGRAREKVEQCYSIERAGRELAGILESMMGQDPEQVDG